MQVSCLERLAHVFPSLDRLVLALEPDVPGDCMRTQLFEPLRASTRLRFLELSYHFGITLPGLTQLRLSLPQLSALSRYCLSLTEGCVRTNWLWCLPGWEGRSL